MGRRALTNDQFVARAKVTHKGKNYGYENTTYVNSLTRVKIICPTHGVFIQVASEHLGGSGCPKCGRRFRRRTTTSEFIAKATEAHKGKYSYEKAEYKNSLETVTITCRAHGDFSQGANDHLRGSGCPRCAQEYTKIRTTMTTEEFCKRAMGVHTDKYIYDDVVYRGALKKVRIRCREHGQFYQNPSNHLRGQGCPSCPKITTINNGLIFVKEAQKVHGNKYGYSNVVYLSSRGKVAIDCPVHGTFQKSPSKHLGGQGCPQCKESNGERETSRALEALGLTYTPQYRIEACRSKYPLPFDFGVFDGEHKLWFLVEFQGAQHFIPVRFSINWSKGDMANALVERQGMDAIKKTYCASNGIPLLEISYKDKRKVIEIVKEFVAKLTAHPSFGKQ